MNIGSQIRSARRKRGLSQHELASRSGIGVATVQNIERNRANPALQTLLALCKVLKIRIRLERDPVKVEWDELGAYGCPLMAEQPVAIQNRSKTRLLEILEEIDLEELKGRQVSACAAWLHAIRDHYPSVWHRIPAAHRAWASNRAVVPKLRRLALATLGSYL